ncbi:hypothetical protein BRADI_5g07817v3 [Brachypodium distachyon]|uniref:Uncharacterized protein n=1 Tax=Brachypodium distachyon TaxID=15368 RepID=A0A2K2CFV2_BRADI|nr:hypothetical protein BRADI_5g07817v3 [Brachypodium distachyon]
MSSLGCCRSSIGRRKAVAPPCRPWSRPSVPQPRPSMHPAARAGRRSSPWSSSPDFGGRRSRLGNRSNPRARRRCSSQVDARPSISSALRRRAPWSERCVPLRWHGFGVSAVSVENGGKKAKEEREGGRGEGGRVTHLWLGEEGDGSAGWRRSGSGTRTRGRGGGRHGVAALGRGQQRGGGARGR